MKTTHRITALAFVLLLGASSAAIADGLRPAPAGVPSLADKHRVHQPFRGERFARTELFFGSARAGGEVTEAEFKQFLDVFITPRFPDGLTLLTGLGQFLGSAGPVQERSFLLILLYPDEGAWREQQEDRGDPGAVQAPIRSGIRPALGPLLRARRLLEARADR